jgi:hypothetical protein
VPEYSFTIGTLFPAEDVVAQFVTVLAMISNDWLRLMADMEAVDAPGPEGQGHEILNYRLQAALHYEAAHFLTEALAETAVREFVGELPDPVREDYETVLAGLGDDPQTGHGDWLGLSRNRTFHYSRLGPRQPIKRALDRTADETGTVSWPRRFGDRRFGYADQVVAEWLPTPDQQEESLARMAAAVTALARFCQAAVGRYLVDRGVLPNIDELAVGGSRGVEAAETAVEQDAS